MLQLETTYSPVKILGDFMSTKSPFSTAHDTIGTGFILTTPGEITPNKRFGYLVTAAHVVENQTNVEVQVAKLDGTLADPQPVRDWRIPNPKLDLAIAPVPAPPPPNVDAYWSHTLELCIPIGAITSTEAGDSIYYIGVLTPLDRVMVRSGTIGAANQEGIPHAGGYEYTSHLVDCRSYGGFSGSPCYLLRSYPTLQPSVWPLPEPYTEPAEGSPHGAMTDLIVLAGMFTEHLTDHPGGETYSSRYGVGVMLRSEEIREALMSDPIRRERAELEQKRSTLTSPVLAENGEDIDRQSSG